MPRPSDAALQNSALLVQKIARYPAGAPIKATLWLPGAKQASDEHVYTLVRETRGKLYLKPDPQDRMPFNADICIKNPDPNVNTAAVVSFVPVPGDEVWEASQKFVKKIMHLPNSAQVALSVWLPGHDAAFDVANYEVQRDGGGIYVRKLTGQPRPEGTAEPTAVSFCIKHPEDDEPIVALVSYTTLYRPNTRNANATPAEAASDTDDLRDDTGEPARRRMVPSQGLGSAEVVSLVKETMTAQFQQLMAPYLSPQGQQNQQLQQQLQQQQQQNQQLQQQLQQQQQQQQQQQ
uniref:Uncharacterized protein n=1 Tax=Neobodo designis TaxID=312471 RepID=A0A7S1PSK2_NEODS